MRWKSGRRSSNVEDRRGETVRHASTGGGLLLLLRFLPGLLRSRKGRGLLIGGVILFFGARLLGIDLLGLLTGQGVAPPPQEPAALSQQDQELADFVSVVLGDTETTWNKRFQAQGKRYEEPVLVLFSGAVNTGCGLGQAAMGPFYCPLDRKVYIDLSFYRDLKTRHGAPGDFAQAYVIAHEIGHHVQNLLGISDRVRQLQQAAGKAEANALSVRLELQADCLAGIWGHDANMDRQMLEQGDLDEALNAAAAIGDDRLQKQAQGYAVPESFTHGTSAQRHRWFLAGFDGGEVSACDTFSADPL
ncbi:neutral zinc metallopeptidase [Motiliproteus sp. SC1-56]|uniref:KPN_02809 family neutral zinc metallopeptidase n=1 Tax=Motiliproteus sp. SC1-56 TaxID=2799565 RepID=UPI001A8FD6A2